MTIFFHQLKQRFPRNKLGELHLHTGCSFERDWDNRALKASQMAFVENIAEQYNFRTFRGTQV